MLAKKNFNPIVLAPHFLGGKFRENWPSVQIYRFPYFFPYRYEHLAYGSGVLYNLKKYPIAIFNIPFFIVSEIFMSIKIVYQKRIHLIHTHWLLPQGLIGALMRCFFHIPHVATVHGSDLTVLKNHRLLIPFCHFIVHNADIVTVNSTFMQQQLVSLAPDSVQKVRVIPMGIEPKKFQTGKFIDMKKKYQSDHLILSVGRLIDLKGTINLINAMPDVLRQFPDTVLLIIGAGPEKETLLNRTCELSLENRIHFPGVVDRENLPSYYHAADIFVLPSINKSGKTEALGVVLLEAMASGCPVIGSNVGGIPDIITDGTNGSLVPEQNPVVLAEKIVALLSDTILAERFRHAGYETVRTRFSWENISRQFSEAYEQVLDQYSRGGAV